MPISRDARTDRRRRLLRDTGEDETQPAGGTRRSHRKTDAEEVQDSLGAKRKAGYSQDVRKACGQRLVQLIPVRRRSYAVVCLISLLIPGFLLAMHYWIHVTGQLPWWRHPLAVALDVGHPHSIAAWLSSQLWLLCLAATVLTFQLRRHKLDDYNGEYRLWFWLVLTCLVASVDATTSITKLFAQALDRWTQVNIGWSGAAVVDSTLAVLIGMLGLRMCSELKAVPLSLVLWLCGLVSWAGSAALARPELQIEMSAPIRYWLISTLWLSGLTLIWLSALTYLRSIYAEAQQRFLLRGRLASVGRPLRQRLRESMPAMPQFMRRGSANLATGTPVGESSDGQKAERSRRRALASEAGATLPSTNSSAASSPVGSPSNTARPSTATASSPRTASAGEDLENGATPRRGLGRFLRRASNSDSQVPSKDSAPATASTRSNEKTAEKPAARPQNAKSSGWGGWLRRGKNDDQADEYRKVSAGIEASGDRRAQRAAAKELKATQRSQAKQARLADKNQGTADAEQPTSARRWLPKLSRPTLPKITRPRSPKPPKDTAPPRNPSQAKALQAKAIQDKSGGLWSRLKVPSISLSAFRLQPPDESVGSKRPATEPQPMRPVSENRPLPDTHSSYVDSFDDDEENDADSDGRPLSKAERKRMRRLQQQNRRSA
ncbi:MAG: hypothetical protein KDA51_13935 [Planctomycetales bacterium]|nr:hypothetical protein [Planctomycetales bacterium]MCA9182558.1 hypothetical protein [Planctomycetales bacterium]